MRRLTLILVVAFVAGCAGGPGAASPTGDVAVGSPIASSAASPPPEPTAAPATATLPPTAAPPSLPPTGVLVAADQPAEFVGDVGEITCSGSIRASDPVAVVHPYEADQTSAELRDYADPAHPRTVCRFDNGISFLVNARQVVTREAWGDRGDLRTGVQAVVDLPELRYHWFEVPGRAMGLSTELLAVSPDLGSVAWISWSDWVDDRGNFPATVYLTDKSGDYRLAEYLTYEGGSCRVRPVSAAFSPSGSHLSVLTTDPGPNMSSLVIVEGGAVRFALRPPAAGWPGNDFVDWAMWSRTSTTLFYSRAAGVFKWTPADGAQLLLPGVRWLYPAMSPDGRYLAYAVPRSDTARDVYLIDLARGTEPELLHADRTLPRFLNSQQLWYAVSSQRSCELQVDSSKVYDILDRAEYASDLQWVGGAWSPTR